MTDSGIYVEVEPVGLDNGLDKTEVKDDSEDCCLRNGRKEVAVS